MDEEELAEAVVQMQQIVGRLSGFIAVDGQPSNTLGAVGAVAWDKTTLTWYGPKTEAGWGDGVRIANDSAVTPEMFQCKGDGIEDDSANFVTAISAASVLGVPLRCDGRYRLKHLYIADQAVNLIGRGTLIHQQGFRIMEVRRTLGPAKAVSAVTQRQVGPDNAVLPTATIVATKITAADAHLFARDDKVMLSASNEYPWSTQYGTELGYQIHVYQTDLVELMGVGQDYTGKANGGFAQGDVVTGATSGATGVVQNAGNNGTATDVVIFRTMGGAFTAGENLTVGGTVRGVASGAAYLLTAEALTYAYTTDVTVRKLKTAPFSIDGLTIEADGDVDQIVGSANRVHAFIMKGLVDPVISNIRIKSAWTRCWRFQSCWRPRATNIQIDKLPNNANTSESAYGYAVEFCGACAYGVAEGLTGGNCRHAFTTNCDGIPESALVGGTQSYATRERYFDGVPKYSLVRNSRIIGSKAEPFDTHVGDLFTRFENCHAEWGTGGAMAVTAPGGFKLRGFGTVVKGCTSEGGLLGFNDYSGTYNAGFNYVQLVEDSVSRRHSRWGFAVTTTPYDQYQRRTIFRRCKVAGYVTEASLPYYQQAFCGQYSGADITLDECEISQFAGAPFFVGSNQIWTVLNTTIDYRMASSSNASAPQIQGTPLVPLFIDGLRIIRHLTNPSLPLAAIRNTTSLEQVVEIKNLTVTNGIGAGLTPLPMFQNTGGGTMKARWKEDGKTVLLDTAAPTTGTWALGDMVKNSSPSAGGVMGWVCTAAGTPGTWKGFGAIAA